MTRPATSRQASAQAVASAAAAIVRAPDITRCLQEAAHQLRAMLKSDAVAIEVPETADGTPAARYTLGFEEDSGGLAPAGGSEGAESAVLARGEGWSECRVALVVPGRPPGYIRARIRATGPAEEGRALDAMSAIATSVSAAMDALGRTHRAEEYARIDAGGEMAAAVGHALRQALFGISSAAQLLRFRASEDPVLERNIGRLLRESDRIARLVDSLVDLGRPVTLDRSEADPEAAWDEAVESHRGQLETRAIVVRRLKAHVQRRGLDVRRFAQALAFMLEGVTERAAEASDLDIASELRADGSWHSRLSFQSAIDPAELHHLFDPLPGPGGGQSGVGLALARRIVHAHGGALTAAPGDGGRTTLTVTLPAN